MKEKKVKENINHLKNYLGTLTAAFQSEDENINDLNLKANAILSLKLMSKLYKNNSPEFKKKSQFSYNQSI